MSFHTCMKLFACLDWKNYYSSTNLNFFTLNKRDIYTVNDSTHIHLTTRTSKSKWDARKTSQLEALLTQENKCLCIVPLVSEFDSCSRLYLSKLCTLHIYPISHHAVLISTEKKGKFGLFRWGCHHKNTFPVTRSQMLRAFATSRKTKTRKISNSHLL